MKQPSSGSQAGYIVLEVECGGTSSAVGGRVERAGLYNQSWYTFSRRAY
jgi:hypothetical protein